MNIRSEISTLTVVVVFGILIGLVYSFLIPTFFPGYRSAGLMILGFLLATLSCGYIGFHASRTSAFPMRLLSGFCYATVALILVYFLSLFIILNLYGA